MSDMPEQIWVGCYYKVDPKIRGFSVGYSCGPCRDHATDMQTVEYIRTDLVPTWQPIETAPKETEILICDINKSVFTGIFDCDGVWGSGYEFFIPQPTHWMPLPQVPSEAI